MMRKNKSRGFSLVELMIVGGLIAGIGLVVMQLFKSTATTQNDAFNSAEYIQLRSEIDLLLSNSYDCQASLKGKTFNGSTIKATPVDVELSYGDQDGKPTRKFISGTDAAFKKYGKLTISEVKFSMPDYTAGTSFADGIGSFKAELVIRGDKKNFGKTKNLNEIKKTINVLFSSTGGVSTIMDCNSSGSSSGGVEVVSSGTGHDGSTGTLACESIGAKCAYVMSTNYIADDAGCPGATHCMRVCLTWYNRSLPGTVNGNGQDNIHSCDAQVGNAVTYLDPGVVRCEAFFTAVCNK